jgi:hypothetical protein
VIQRVQHIVYATVVMQCSADGDCRQMELEMGKRGFQPRGAIVQRARGCVCFFVQEHARGTAEKLRDEACMQLSSAAQALSGMWRGYVQVCGNDGAWATLVPGKQPVLGAIS